MTVVAHQQAKIVYEEATLDTEDIITSLIDDGKIDAEQATYCRANTITHLDSCDMDADVMIAYTDAAGIDHHVYYSSRMEEEKLWIDDGEIDDDLDAFFREIGRTIGI